jgi:hypothetical protein
MPVDLRPEEKSLAEQLANRIESFERSVGDTFRDRCNHFYREYRGFKRVTYGVPVTLMNVLDPDAKPGQRRSPSRVLEPKVKRPKFLEDYYRAHHMEGFEGLEDED